MLKQVELQGAGDLRPPHAQPSAPARVGALLGRLREGLCFTRPDLAPYARNTRHWWQGVTLARAARRDLAALGDLAAAEAQATQRTLLALQDELGGCYAYKDLVRKGAEQVLAPEDLERLNELQSAYDAAVAADRAAITAAARARRAADAEGAVWRLRASRYPLAAADTQEGSDETRR